MFGFSVRAACVATYRTESAKRGLMGLGGRAARGAQPAGQIPVRPPARIQGEHRSVRRHEDMS